MNQKTILKREIKTALEMSINDHFDERRLADELNEHRMIDHQVDEEETRKLIKITRDNIDGISDDIAQQFADQIELNTNAESAEFTSQNKKIMTDGGGILSRATHNTIALSVMSVNSFMLGGYFGGTTDEWIAIGAVLSSILMLGYWLSTNYDITVKATE